MIIRIKDQVQLSISSTRAYFHKYCLDMKYRYICKLFILSESPSSTKWLNIDIFCGYDGE